MQSTAEIWGSGPFLNRDPYISAVERGWNSDLVTHFWKVFEIKKRIQKCVYFSKKPSEPDNIGFCRVLIRFSKDLANPTPTLLLGWICEGYLGSQLISQSAII